MWGANGKDSYAQFHGRDQRNRFNIEWSTRKAWKGNSYGDTDQANIDADDNADPPAAGIASRSLSMLPVIIGLALAIGDWNFATEH
jgi:hypothetical protein